MRLVARSAGTATRHRAGGTGRIAVEIFNGRKGIAGGNGGRGDLAGLSGGRAKRHAVVPAAPFAGSGNFPARPVAWAGSEAAAAAFGATKGSPARTCTVGR